MTYRMDLLGPGLLPWFGPVPLPPCYLLPWSVGCSKFDFEVYAYLVAAAFRSRGAEMNASKLIEVYDAVEVQMPGGNRSKWYWAIKHMGSDYAMICPARRSVRWWHQAGITRQLETVERRSSERSEGSVRGGEGSGGSGGSAVGTRGGPGYTHTDGKLQPPSHSYLYLFDHAPDAPSGKYPRLAFHASEIPFVFQDLSATGPRREDFHISKHEVPPPLLARSVPIHMHSWALPLMDYCNACATGAALAGDGNGVARVCW